MTALAQNLTAVRARITAAAEAAGRNPADITLVAVSKYHPRESLIEALQAGVADFGENYVQEAQSKFPLDGARLHFIGPLQRNKVRKILPLAHLIHGISSQPVLEAVDRIAGELGLQAHVLLQLHLTNEPTKNGFLPEEFREILPLCRELSSTSVQGIMCMGPLEGGPEAARPIFIKARGLLQELQEQIPEAKTLSMGMSADFEIAIAEGSTMVRVGTAIFGPRPTKNS